MEFFARVGYKGIKEDAFGAYPMAFVMAIHTAAARGEADIDPVGSTVAMASKAGGIDEGLGQQGLDAVGGHPIGGDLPQGKRQHMGGQVLDAHVGQDQEARIRHDVL